MYFWMLLVLFVGLVGGLFYGYSYLKARAYKQSVGKTLVDNVDELLKK